MIMSKPIKLQSSSLGTSCLFVCLCLCLWETSGGRPIESIVVRRVNVISCIWGGGAREKDNGSHAILGGPGRDATTVSVCAVSFAFLRSTPEVMEIEWNEIWFPASGSHSEPEPGPRSVIDTIWGSTRPEQSGHVEICHVGFQILKQRVMEDWLRPDCDEMIFFTQYDASQIFTRSCRSHLNLVRKLWFLEPVKFS